MHTEQATTGQPSGYAPGNPAALFEARDVTVRFGGLLALNEVSFAVAPRQVHGVIGPNGAGKTTLFNVCCGFLRPDGGTLHRDGKPIRPPRPHQLARMGIARTLQGVGLFEGLTVLENVMVGAEVYHRSGFLSALLALPKSSSDERHLAELAEDALERLGVAEYAHRPAASLAYPIKKRVAIARALAQSPSLLLLDEPCSGLSHTDIDELAELVAALAERMAIAVVDHHMDFVMSVCDRITVLDFGEVIAAGSPERIKQEPAVLSAYLGDTEEVDDD